MKEVRTERDAELRRAMAVVEAAILYCRREAFCPLCDGGIPAHDGKPYQNHEATCPLIANGFIDAEGKRAPRSGARK